MLHTILRPFAFLARAISRLLAFFLGSLKFAWTPPPWLCAAGRGIAHQSRAAIALLIISATVSYGAWCGTQALTITAGKGGVQLLRWELVRKAAAGSATSPGPASTLALEHEITLDPSTDYLMRCDRVGFPAGGEALTHVHQGPGIRCLLSGSIRIDSEGASHAYTPGEAWFESGPEPVYAAASLDAPSAFARVMILPRTCHGKSSIRYVKPEDAGKPKSQTYQIFADEFITP